MRPIDADELKEYIDAQKGRPFIGCTVGEAFKIMTDEQPTVDAVPVVRCKDCKYYRDGDCWHEWDNDGQIYYQSVIDEPNPDDYCSRAERKEE